MPKLKKHARPVRSAEFRCYEELNDFLPIERRKVSFNHSFHGTPSVKDTIQAIGIPHGAVDLILVNGVSVDFNYRLRGGERVAVYPVFERLDISPSVRLRPKPLRDTRFILDVHLGKLARYLRMLGFDAAYSADWNDEQIIRLALDQRRIILTRDRGILKQNRVSHGHWVRHQDPMEQLEEVLNALDLFSKLQAFTRCLECNEAIESVEKSEIQAVTKPEILGQFDEFWRCNGCGRVYWKGSHYDRMLERIAHLSPT